MTETISYSVLGPLSQQEIEQIYARLMQDEFYDENYNSALWVDEPYRLMANILCPMFDLSADSRVMDIGSGAGFLVSSLAALGVNAHGYEFSGRMLNQIEPERRAAFSHVTAIEQVPVASASLVVSMEVFEHLPLSTIRHNLAYLYDNARCPIVLTIPSSGRDRTVTAAGFYENDARRLAGMSDNTLFPYLWLENGLPGAGHISLAGFQWWEDLFLMSGFRRDSALEARFDAYADIVQAYRWCPYILRRLEPGMVQPGRGWLADDRGGHWSGVNAELVFRTTPGAVLELAFERPDINYMQENIVTLEIERLRMDEARIEKDVVFLRRLPLDGAPVRIALDGEGRDLAAYRLRLYSPMWTPRDVGAGDDVRPRGMRLASAVVSPA